MDAHLELGKNKFGNNFNNNDVDLLGDKKSKQLNLFVNAKKNAKKCKKIRFIIK